MLYGMMGPNGAMNSDTDKVFSALEVEFNHLIRQRPRSYLQDVISAGCFVYGAGSYGRRIAALLRDHSMPCYGIIDRKFGDDVRELDGVPTFHPDRLKASDAAGKCLLIGIHNPTVWASDIVGYGESRGFKDVLWNADIPDALGPQADNYWLSSRDETLAHFDDLRAAASLWNDTTSFATLVALLRFRMTGSASDAPEALLNRQYLPSDLFSFSHPISLVDGGAYDGDTLRHLLKCGVQVQEWLAFEPDPENFAVLTSFAKTQAARTTLFPCGLADHFTHLPFSADGTTSSHLSTSTNADFSVPCVALDDVVQGIRPHYIKLDIEGGERSALLGMRNTIAASQPHLAVSCYHRPEDLWQLPETIRMIFPGATLHLRQHGLNAFETVLYAIPKEN